MIITSFVHPLHLQDAKSELTVAIPKNAAYLELCSALTGDDIVHPCTVHYVYIIVHPCTIRYMHSILADALALSQPSQS